jgi:hypothetical protein
VGLTTSKRDLDDILVWEKTISGQLNKTFNVYAELHRGVDVTPYQENDCYNDAVGLLLPFDVGANSGITGAKNIEINNIQILCDNPNGLLLPKIFFFPVSDIAGVSFDDNQPFIPYYADIPNYTNYFTGFAVTKTLNLSHYFKNDLKTIVRSDVDNKIYILVVLNGAYTPLNGEYIQVQIQGKIKN